MRPFKMFFGLAIGIILIGFLAKIAFIAFIAAAVMSIAYAVFRRIKDFITYDSYGNYYIDNYNKQGINHRFNNEVEPLFQENNSNRFTSDFGTHFVKIG